MRKESRKRLERHVWRELMTWVPAFAALAIVIAGLVIFQLGKREARNVVGTVENSVWRLNSDTGQQYPFIQAKLESGETVRVGTVALSLPEVGTRITLRQRSMLFDYLTTYSWNGRAHPAKASMLPAATPVSLH